MFLTSGARRAILSSLPISQCRPQFWSTPRSLFAATSVFQHQRRDPRILQAHAIASHARDAYTYPENLNVFDAGWGTTMSIGFSRVACTVFAAYGLITLPSAVVSGSAPLYMIPVYAIYPVLPLAIMGLAFGGYVSHINVWLPPQARRSKEDLVRFASNIPAGTELQIKSLYFRPWPHTQELQFKQLRKLPRSWSRLTNIELQPQVWSQQDRTSAKRSPLYDWVARTLMGRFYVRTGQLRSRSRVSGVWEKMWEQIPTTGESSRRTSAQAGDARATLPRTSHATARNR